MSKTTMEKRISIEEQIKQLENQRKQLIQKEKAEERAARTKLLCSRGGYLESRLPETITLTDEQYKIFLEKNLVQRIQPQNIERINGAEHRYNRTHTLKIGGKYHRNDGGRI